MKTFFYIIHRDGQIFEIENTGERFTTALKQWQNGGLVVFPTLGVGINTSDITKILNTEQYDSFIDSSQPKMFIKNGTWFDIKERSKPVRYEKWRELELEENKKLTLTDGQKEATQEQVDGWIKKYRPAFMNNVEKLIPPKDPDSKYNTRTINDF